MKKIKTGTVKKKFINTWKLMKETVMNFMAQRGMKMSAALSYYTIFSLPSLLVLVISLTSIFFGQDAVEGKIFGFMEEYVGPATAKQIQDALAKTSVSHNTVWTTIIGGATLLFAATAIFGEVQDSINFIWGLKAKPKKGLILMVVNRVLSFSMIIVLAFILMVSLLLSTLLEVFLKSLHDNFPDWLVSIATYADYVIIFFTIATLFMFIFKVLPDAKIRWKDAFSGALVCSLFFMVGQYLISFYIKRGSVGTAYGATASILVLLLWVYFSSIILYFGAEFTQSYARHKGRRIQPNRYSVFIQNIEVETKHLPAEQKVESGKVDGPIGPKG